MSESSPTDVQRIEVITSVQRRRRWSVAEKIEIVEETEQPHRRARVFGGTPIHQGNRPLSIQRRLDHPTLNTVSS